jgi:hypothetical protein
MNVQEKTFKLNISCINGQEAVIKFYKDISKKTDYLLKIQKIFPEFTGLHIVSFDNFSKYVKLNIKLLKVDEPYVVLFGLFYGIKSGNFYLTDPSLGVAVYVGTDQQLKDYLNFKDDKNNIRDILIAFKLSLDFNLFNLKEENLDAFQLMVKLLNSGVDYNILNVVDKLILLVKNVNLYKSVLTILYRYVKPKKGEKVDIYYVIKSIIPVRKFSYLTYKATKQDQLYILVNNSAKDNIKSYKILKESNLEEVAIAFLDGGRIATKSAFYSITRGFLDLTTILPDSLRKLLPKDFYLEVKPFGRKKYLLSEKYRIINLVTLIKQILLRRYFTLSII